MIRALIGLLVAAIAAAFVRAIIAMITREVKGMVNPESEQAQGGPNPAPPPPSGGSGQPLRKCVVCGTYTPADRLISSRYCSQKCAAQAS